MFAGESFQPGQVQKKPKKKTNIEVFPYDLHFFQRQSQLDFHISYTVYSSVNDVKEYYVCFMFYLLKTYFRLFCFFSSAVLADLVYWVMMDGHATIQEYCIICLATILFSLTHVIKGDFLFFFLQMEQ